MIGIFDSGIGGLTVVRELLRQDPDAPFVYLGDTARAPYGNKSPETVARYAQEDAEFLLSKGATSLIIACNTASALAAESLRASHPNLQIFDVIGPAVEEALRMTKGRIGIIGTRATVGSRTYEKALQKHAVESFSLACPLFVQLVEEGWLDDAETKRIVRRYLSPLRQKGIDALILGCTHYPLLAPIIQRYMGKQVTLVDSGASVVKQALASRDAGVRHAVPLRVPAQTYYLTDYSLRSQEIAEQWLGRSVKFQ